MFVKKRLLLLRLLFATICSNLRVNIVLIFLTLQFFSFTIPVSHFMHSVYKPAQASFAQASILHANLMWSVNKRKKCFKPNECVSSHVIKSFTEQVVETDLWLTEELKVDVTRTNPPKVTVPANGT